MIYIYHYYSVHQVCDGSINHIDGIAKITFPVESMEDYRKLKVLIDGKNHEKLTIVSLNLLKVV